MSRRTLLMAWFLFLIPFAVLQAAERREIAFPDIPGYKTLKCDLHMHTVFSDGLVWPTVRVDEAWREGLDAISITDHVEYKPHKPDVTGSRNRPYELAVEHARVRNILLVRGVEITRDTPPGHFNVLFLKDADPLDTKDFYEVFEQAAQQKAFIMWNHPGWQGPERGRWGDAQTRLFEQKRLHAIEICNGDEFYTESFQWALDRKLTVMGSSDIHPPASDLPRTPKEHRTLTLVFARDRTVDGIREALDAGRTAVWWQNQLLGREEHLATLFAGCLRIEPPHGRGESFVRCEVRNLCELDIELQRVGPGQPRRIVLPAKATSLVHLDTLPEDSPKGPTYRVLNLLVGPDKPLVANLRIPKALTSKPADN